MRKFLTVLMCAIAVLAAGISTAQANEETFTISATVPTATGIGFVVSSVDADFNFTPVAGTDLSFDPMTFDPENGIYLPDHFFAIDIAAVGGAGIPTVTADYTEGNNPNDPGNGLGFKSAATFVRVEGPEGEQTEVELGRDIMANIVGVVVTPDMIAGGFLRVYLGIVTGDETTPIGGEPFTNGDQPGLYDGTLLLSGTVI